MHMLNSVESPSSQSEALPCTSQHFLLAKITLSLSWQP